MLSLGVDLAAISSAACLLDEKLQVLSEFDSIQSGNTKFISRIILTVERLPETILIVEDLPPLGRFDLQAKQACILQGRIIERMLLNETTGRLFWVQPIVWMRAYGYRNKAQSGSTASWAKQTTYQFGYAPPSNIHGKVLQDYRDAYMIARWGHEKLQTAR